MQQSIGFKLDDHICTKRTLNHSLIEKLSLIFLMMTIRSDLVFIVNVLNQFVKKSIKNGIK